MTYIIKQKSGGRIYAYEVQAYWDPVKKQARQKRRYLGVWDEATGTILKKEIQKDVKCKKEFGSAYLLKAISEEKRLLCYPVIISLHKISPPSVISTILT
ncbi:MAG: hypothetical protein QW115_07085 [Thermoplasmata archaeon]